MALLDYVGERFVGSENVIKKMNLPLDDCILYYVIVDMLPVSSNHFLFWVQSSQYKYVKPILSLYFNTIFPVNHYSTAAMQGCHECNLKSGFLHHIFRNLRMA